MTEGVISIEEAPPDVNTVRLQNLVMLDGVAPDTHILTQDNVSRATPTTTSGVFTSSTATQTRLDGFQVKDQPVCWHGCWLEICIGNTTPVNAVY